MKGIKKLAVLVLAACAPLVAYAGDDLEMTHSWIKMPVPGTSMTGGFVSITNVGFEGDHLLSASADFAKKVELHTMVMVDGVMQMRQVAGGWAIAEGETLTLAPGGKHIMFMGLTQMLMDGDSRTVTLQFANAGTIEKTFMVHQQGGMSDMNMDHDHKHEDHENHQ